MSLFDMLSEQLKKPIYSDVEAKDELALNKNTSQVALPHEVENSYVTYDPFSLWTNNSLQAQSAFVHQQAEMIRGWRAMLMTPEVDECVNEIINEAVVFDENDKVIDLNLDEIELTKNVKNKITEAFQKIMFMMDFNEKGDEIFKQWYVDGTLAIETVFNNAKMKDGIQKLVMLSPYNLFKYKDEKTGLIQWFYCMQPTYNIIKDYQHSERIFKEDQISQIVSGIWDIEKRIPLSFLNKAAKTANQLGLIEDSLVIFRITRSPEKRIFYIDTGNLPKSKAEEYVRSLINKYRQKRIYNTETGSIENKSRQMSILEDFWFPVSNSQAGGQRGTRVETLQGLNPGFGDFSDVNYFVDKLYKSLGVPSQRKNSESRFTVTNGVDIEKDELKFFKFILKLRRKFNNLFIDLMKKELISTGVLTLDVWNQIQEKIKFVYANSNEYSTIKKLQMISIRVDAANAALQLADPMNSKIISKKWIQREIMMLTDKEQRLVDKEIEEEKAEVAEQGMAGAEGAFGQEGAGPIPSGTPEQQEKEEQDANKFGGNEAASGGDVHKPMIPFGGPKPKNESGLPQHILENIQEGDVISNGKQKLQYTKGKFIKVQ